MGEKIATLRKTSLVDYPDIVSAVIFFAGCDLACPYCYNTALARGTLPSDNALDFQGICDYLYKRAGVISGVVLSGGEPLLKKDLLFELIPIAKHLGYKIKLDTNGTLPSDLAFLINNKDTRPDFIAMDIKTSPKKYYLLSKKNGGLVGCKTLQEDRAGGDDGGECFSAIQKSIDLISQYPPECREFRTVLFPPLVDESAIFEMAAVLPSNASWRFSQFMNGDCLSQEYNDLPPYTLEQAKELVKAAQFSINGAFLSI